MQKQRDHLTRLHDSDREYYGWLLSGILWVLALFAAGMMFESILSPPTVMGPQADRDARFLLGLVRYGLSIWAYVIAINRWVRYRWLQRFDKTIAMFERRIAKLEAKQSLRPVASTV